MSQKAQTVKGTEWEKLGVKKCNKIYNKKRQNPAPSSVRRRGGRNLVSGHKK